MELEKMVEKVTCCLQYQENLFGKFFIFDGFYTVGEHRIYFKFPADNSRFKKGPKFSHPPHYNNSQTFFIFFI